MPRKLLALGAVLLLVALGVLGLVLAKPRQAGLVGAEFEPARPAADIQLIDHNGGPFDLGQTRGKVVLIYFGYTHCPDECPLTMAKLSTAFDLLNEDGSRVQVLLITTDPARDTPAALRTYLSPFHASFLGLTGDASQLEPVYEAYGVVVMDGGETHGNRIYVIDRAGNLRLTLPYEQTASEIASDVKVLTAE